MCHLKHDCQYIIVLMLLFSYVDFLGKDFTLTLLLQNEFAILPSMTERDEVGDESAVVKYVTREDLIDLRPDLVQALIEMNLDMLETIANDMGEALQSTYYIAMAAALDHHFGEAPDSE